MYNGRQFVAVLVCYDSDTQTLRIMAEDDTKSAHDSKHKTDRLCCGMHFVKEIPLEAKQLHPILGD